MDAILGISVLLMGAGLLVGIAGLVILIIMAITKKDIKVPGIITGSGFGVFVLATIILVIVSISSADDTTTTASYPTSSSEAQSDEETEYSEPNAHIEESSDDKSEADEEEVVEEGEPAEEEDLMTEDVEEVEEEIDESENPENLDNYRTDVDVRDIERNPDEYEGEFITFEGKIIQVMEGDVMNGYRIAVNDDYDRIVYVETLAITLDERLLEDDYITVYGSFNELVTYETVVGGSRTLPGFTAHGDRMILQ